MRKTIALGSVTVFLLALVGCGGSSADSVVKNQIKLMNELAEAIEKKADDAKVKEIDKRLKDNTEQMKKIAEADGKKAMEANMKEYTEAAARLAKASMGKAFEGMVPGGMPKIPGM